VLPDGLGRDAERGADQVERDGGLLALGGRKGVAADPRGECGALLGGWGGSGTELSYPADAYAFIHQQIWMLQGRLRFREGDTEHELDAGDCLQLGPPAPCSFINPTRETCRYLVALTKRHA